jgi:hypothetical protein
MVKLQTIIILIIWLVGFTLAGCTKETTPLLEYTLLTDKSYEDASSAEIIWEILVSPNITKESLENLLSKLYELALEEATSEKDRPTVIDIKAYTSEKYAKSDLDQWIGWVSKTGFNTKPRFKYNERQFNNNGESTEIKFGLSKLERYGIWKKIIRAEDRAADEALKEFPDMTPLEEFEELENELLSKFKSDLAQTEGLTLEQLGEIAQEAQDNDWPYPLR